MKPATVSDAWYWNRYPARAHSESYSYAYSFSEEILKKWNWSEQFSGQAENERYYNFVADKHNMHKDIPVQQQGDGSQVPARRKSVGSRGKKQRKGARARYMIAAPGPLSAVQMPRIEGIDSFKGGDPRALSRLISKASASA